TERAYNPTRREDITMFPVRGVLVALSVLALTAMQARSGEKEKEPDAILEIGGSGNWSLSDPSSSLLKNPRHGESVVIQFSVTNRRRLACGAHL
ncbi:MAG TPA: hypothetical protein VN861_05390, partial [Candidatus Acidoferrales bacterium]|nr:hypothetical protein [Candidatus Acidoferrales bacterium]